MKKKENSSALNSIGHTPLINQDGIFVKLEYLTPSGSVKDRMAQYIMEKAEKTGELKAGYRIVEASSGNTGIAFALLSAAKGYDCTIVLPKGLSREREEMIRAFGADLEFVHKNCVKCAIQKTREIAAKNKKVFLPRQFENPWNVQENEKKFGKEILLQLHRQKIKKIDAFVAGVGTGGTLIGVGKALQKEFLHIELIAVEPSECPLLSENRFGKHGIFGLHKTHTCHEHGIEGIGDGFIPKIVSDNRDLIDEIFCVSTKKAIQTSKQLARQGFLVGPSSGANFWAAKKAQKKFNRVLTLFPDRGERYLSEKLF